MIAGQVAVVGTGFIGPIHVEALRRAGLRVKGIVGSSADKSTAAAAHLGLNVGYANFEQVLADPQIAAVHITTPNRDHFPMAKAALEAGKHVLCEKPLAMNSEESHELVELARQYGLAAGVAYNVRYYPLCLEAKSQVRSGSLGPLQHIHGSYVQDWLLRDDDFNWRVLASEGGPLRALADIGTHWLDLAQSVTGQKVSAVCANLRTVHPIRKRPVGSAQTFSDKMTTHKPERVPVAIDTEDCGSVLLEFDNGMTGMVWVSQVTAGRKNTIRFELGGLDRALAWNSETPNEIWCGRRNEPNQQLVRDPALLSPEARHFCSYPGGHNEGFPDTFKQLFRDFYGCIAAGTYNDNPTYPTFEDGHAEIVLCEAILTSHRERRWVTVAA